MIQVYLGVYSDRVVVIFVLVGFEVDGDFKRKTGHKAFLLNKKSRV